MILNSNRAYGYGLLLLSIFLLSACSGKNSLITSEAALPEDWRQPQNFLCLKSYHANLTFSQDLSKIIEACTDSMAKGWPPALTATAMAQLSLFLQSKKQHTQDAPNRSFLTMFEKAAEANEPLAMTMYGGIVGGALGRKLISESARAGQLQGTYYMMSRATLQTASEENVADGYWASFIAEQSTIRDLSAYRKNLHDKLPFDQRSSLKANALTVRLGHENPTPVSSMVTFDLLDAINDRKIIKLANGKPLVMLRMLGDPHPLIHKLALVLAADDEVAAVVRNNVDNYFRIQESMSQLPW